MTQFAKLEDERECRQFLLLLRIFILTICGSADSVLWQRKWRNDFLGWSPRQIIYWINIIELSNEYALIKCWMGHESHMEEEKEEEVRRASGVDH